MTYADLISNATFEERVETKKRVEAIIGTKEQATANIKDLAERINARSRWQTQYEKLAKVFLEHGDKALALAYTQQGRHFKGVTASGKRWVMDGNNGWTARSLYCGTLYVEGEGVVFTSGRLDRVFEYILNL